MSKDFRLWCCYLICASVTIKGTVSLISIAPLDLKENLIVFFTIVAAVLSIPLVKSLNNEN